MRKIANIDDFLILVGEIINIAWGSKWGTYSRSYPTSSESNVLPLPMITSRLVSKRPASMGSASEIKPRVRKEYKDPNDSSNVITILGQRFDCIVDFSVWTDSQEKAFELSERFEESMLSYAGIFKEHGLVDLVYLETTDDIPIMSTRISTTAATASKSILYKAVIDKLTPVSHNTIEKVRVRLAEREDILTDLSEFLNEKP